MTPLQAWQATNKVEPPGRGATPSVRSAGTGSGSPATDPTRFHVTPLMTDQTVYLIETDEQLLALDDRGTEIIRRSSPKPATA